MIVTGGSDDRAAIPPGWVHVGSDTVESVQVQPVPAAVVPANGDG